MTRPGRSPNPRETRVGHCGSESCKQAASRFRESAATTNNSQCRWLRSSSRTRRYTCGFLRARDAVLDFGGYRAQAMRMRSFTVRNVNLAVGAIRTSPEPPRYSPSPVPGTGAERSVLRIAVGAARAEGPGTTKTLDPVRTQFCLHPRGAIHAPCKGFRRNKGDGRCRRGRLGTALNCA